MRILLFLPALLALGLASCGSPSSSSSPSLSGVLLTEAQGPGVYESKSALVGTPFPVTVSALGLPDGDCGIGPCPAGSEELTAISAECEAGACSAVVSVDATGVPTFMVTPTVAGSTVLHVHLRGTSGRGYSDTLALTFVASAHLEVHESLLPLLNRVKYADLPGSELTWQITLDSDDGVSLAADASQAQAAVEGSAYALGSNSKQDPSYITLDAVQPGTAVVQLSLGASSRSLSLSVIDVSDVTGVEFHAIPPATEDQTIAQTLEGPDVFSPDAVTSLTETTAQGLDGSSAWAVVLHTKSGALAMGGAALLSVVPKAFGSVATFDDGLFKLWADPTSSTTGTLTGTIGSALVSVPIVLTSN
jgi:hypothetical protein